MDRIVSTLYLQQYLSDTFDICTSYQATSEGVLHVMFVSKFKNLKVWRISLNICNFDFVFFWLGIQYDSILWVIMYPQNAGVLVVLVQCGLVTPSRVILCMYPANQRQCCISTWSLIGWAHTQNDPCTICNHGSSESPLVKIMVCCLFVTLTKEGLFSVGLKE